MDAFERTPGIGTPDDLMDVWVGRSTETARKRCKHCARPVRGRAFLCLLLFKREKFTLIGLQL